MFEFELQVVTATSGSVAATSTSVLVANDGRLYASFVNDSDTAMYLSFGAAAITSAGVRINANGGSYEITNQNMFRGIVYAIHGGSGTKNMSVLEGT